MSPMEWKYLLCDPDLPYELPHPLYSIQLWRIGWKEIEYYVGILFNELLDHSGVVIFRVVKDEMSLLSSSWNAC